MPTPSLNDKSSVFTNVLSDSQFRRDGVLFSTETEASMVRNCRWVVIDPNRHTMRIWRKPYRLMDFLAAGQALNASVFTNGPYIRAPRVSGDPVEKAKALDVYLGQGYRQERTSLREKLSSYGVPPGMDYALAHGLTELNMLFDLADFGAAKKPSIPIINMIPDVSVPGIPETLPRIETQKSKENWDKLALEYFGGFPCGSLIIGGTRIYIRHSTNLTDDGYPLLAYFGRASNTGFSSYSIGTGIPEKCHEAIGGLLLSIDDYKVTDYERGKKSNQYFYWGLAPLSGTESKISSKELGTSVSAYQKATATSKPIEGLVIGLFYQSNSHAQLLAEVGVRKAVCLDPSDSVLFGRQKEILWGNSMLPYKRVSQNWGFAFFPSP